MKLYIDSGATKTEFILKGNDNSIYQFHTAGINVNYVDDPFIRDQFILFIDHIKPIDFLQISEIRYYGAGCFNLKNGERVREIILSLFPHARIGVYSDLMAVCHALCGNEPGYVGILGTGAASCHYDGNEIIDKAPSLGYLLGDEGSGTYLGKVFLQHYLKGMLSKEIGQHFEDYYQLTSDMVIPQLYRNGNPQTLMASIPVFMAQEINSKEISNIIFNAFDLFLNIQKEYYQKEIMEWYFSGSIGFYFHDILEKAANKNNMIIKKIVQSPLKSLIEKM